MASTYAATLLYDIDHPGFPLKTDPGNFWGTVAACISKYDKIYDRVQIAGSTYVHDGKYWSSLRSVAGYWELDKDDFAVVSGERLSKSNTVTAAAVNGMNNLYPTVKVGWIYENSIERKLPVLWDQKGMKKLGSLGGIEGSANDINDSGQIVGYSLDPDGNKRAFLWTERPFTLNPLSAFVDLGTLGGLNSEAMAINNSGQVVGWAEDANGKKQPFIWSLATTDGSTGNKRMKAILTDQFDTGVAFDINDKGSVVGSLGDFPNTKGFLWDGASPLAMPLPTTGGPTTVAQAINNNDEIVGYSFDAGLKIHPVKWENNNLTTLDNHVAGLFPSLTLGSAEGINDDGYIICTANIGQMTFSVLLTPLYMHPVPPLYYRPNFLLLAGMPNGGNGAAPGPNGRLLHPRPAGAKDKKRDDIHLLHALANTALSLNDDELRMKFYSALTKTGGKKRKKINKKIRKQNTKR